MKKARAAMDTKKKVGLWERGKSDKKSGRVFSPFSRNSLEDQYWKRGFDGLDMRTTSGGLII